MKRNLLLAHPWFAAYNNDGGQGGADGGGAGAGAGDGGSGGSDAAAKAAADAAAKAAAATKLFTQEQLNKILADDKRKHQDQVKQTVSQLEELKKTAQLTAEEKDKLQAQLDGLNQSLLTAEEKAKLDLAKKDKEFKSREESLIKERDQWRSNYAGEVITNQILKASTIHDALSAEQIQDLLMPKTRLVEVVGTDGRTVTGYAPKVKIRLPNEKGEDVELDLGVEEAVKRMKETPEKFGNLFKSGVKGGLGGNGSTGAGSGGNTSITELAKKDPETYRKGRKQHGLGRK